MLAVLWRLVMMSYYCRNTSSPCPNNLLYQLDDLTIVIPTQSNHKFRVYDYLITILCLLSTTLTLSFSPRLRFLFLQRPDEALTVSCLWYALPQHSPNRLVKTTSTRSESEKNPFLTTQHVAEGTNRLPTLSTL